jgi:hypothetical protein
LGCRANVLHRGTVSRDDSAVDVRMAKRHLLIQPMPSPSPHCGPRHDNWQQPGALCILGREILVIGDLQPVDRLVDLVGEIICSRSGSTILAATGFDSLPGLWPGDESH